MIKKRKQSIQEFWYGVGALALAFVWGTLWISIVFKQAPPSGAPAICPGSQNVTAKFQPATVR